MILENNKTIDGEKQKGLLSEQEAKILIVDDEKDIRKLVGIYLKKQGYKHWKQRMDRWRSML